jgi:hypothetical protein
VHLLQSLLLHGCDISHIGVATTCKRLSTLRDLELTLQLVPHLPELWNTLLDLLRLCSRLQRLEVRVRSTEGSDLVPQMFDPFQLRPLALPSLAHCVWHLPQMPLLDAPELRSLELSYRAVGGILNLHHDRSSHFETPSLFAGVTRFAIPNKPGSLVVLRPWVLLRLPQL